MPFPDLNVEGKTKDAQNLRSIKPRLRIGEFGSKKRPKQMDDPNGGWNPTKKTNPLEVTCSSACIFS